MGHDRWRAYLDSARLAPSKHNAQPWWFEVGADGTVVALHADGARATPASDPQGRDLVIGCGAALFNLTLAMRCAGYQPEVELLPAGPDFSVLARVREGPPCEPARGERALLAAVAERHTNRNPLDGTLLAPDVPFLLQSAAEAEGAGLHLVTRDGPRTALAALVERANHSAACDPGVEAELRAWVRAPGDEREDGIPARSAGPGAAAAYRAAFVQRDFDVDGTSRGTRHDSTAADRPLIAVLWTAGDRPADWLDAGRALEAVLVTATAHGAAASLLNQPLEIPALRAAVRDELALPGFPQAILRIGIGAPTVATPRRPLDDVVVVT